MSILAMQLEKFRAQSGTQVAMCDEHLKLVSERTVAPPGLEVPRLLLEASTESTRALENNGMLSPLVMKVLHQEVEAELLDESNKTPTLSPLHRGIVDELMTELNDQLIPSTSAVSSPRASAVPTIQETHQSAADRRIEWQEVERLHLVVENAQDVSFIYDPAPSAHSRARLADTAADATRCQILHSQHATLATAEQRLQVAAHSSSLLDDELWYLQSTETARHCIRMMEEEERARRVSLRMALSLTDHLLAPVFSACLREITARRSDVPTEAAVDEAGAAIGIAAQQHVLVAQRRLLLQCFHLSRLYVTMPMTFGGY